MQEIPNQRECRFEKLNFILSPDASCNNSRICLTTVPQIEFALKQMSVILVDFNMHRCFICRCYQQPLWCRLLVTKQKFNFKLFLLQKRKKAFSETLFHRICREKTSLWKLTEARKWKSASEKMCKKVVCVWNQSHESSLRRIFQLVATLSESKS